MGGGADPRYHFSYLFRPGLRGQDPKFSTAQRSYSYSHAYSDSCPAPNSTRQQTGDNTGSDDANANTATGDATNGRANSNRSHNSLAWRASAASGVEA